MTSLVAEKNTLATLNVNQAIGSSIAQYLFLNSMSRAQLGDYLGVAGANISMRLHGKSKWSAEDLLAVSALFGVTVNDLMPTPDGQGGWIPAPYVAPYVQQKP
ncbi:MAG: helix-turn-helix transcriptional regulator, partial [Actinomycetaceae bacterium]|nr:helix-turn-helix transcriptional regulator [Actinomycetaceae bacterium]